MVQVGSKKVYIKLNYFFFHILLIAKFGYIHLCMSPYLGFVTKINKLKLKWKKH
jgi:hypothetical protein